MSSYQLFLGGVLGNISISITVLLFFYKELLVKVLGEEAWFIITIV